MVPCGVLLNRLVFCVRGGVDLVPESELDWERLLCQIEGDLEAGFTYRSVASEVDTYWLFPKNNIIWLGPLSLKSVVLEEQMF